MALIRPILANQVYVVPSTGGISDSVAVAGASGTVTSVALSVPGALSVSGSPITGSGTFTVTWATGQTANQFLATPNGSTGAVSLRAIVAADLPSLATIYLPLSNATNSVVNGVNPQDAVTVSQLNAAVAAIDTKANCQAATTTTLAAATYNNGSSGIGATLTLTVAAVLVLDGYTPILNDRLLIKNQSDPTQNGSYSLTTVGVVGVTQAVLTRTTDFDQPMDVDGAIFSIVNGGTNGGTRWQCLVSGTPVFGMTAFIFSPFLGETYTADETTLHLSGTTFSIISTYIGQTSITTLGTIGTGVWQASVIAPAYLSTATGSALGISKPDGSTITISGGTLAAATATGSALGIVKPDGLTIGVSAGVISAIASTFAQGRLGGTSGSPFNQADQLAIGTLYYTPCTGNLISLYASSVWTPTVFTETTLSLSGLASGTACDIFGYSNSGTLALEADAWRNSGQAITGATNATPIVLTSAAHGLSINDTVVVGGVQGNTAANGLWTVSAVTTNTITLSGSVGNAAYTSATGWLSARIGGTLSAFGLGWQNGILVKATDSTRRYLGSIYCNGSGTTEWSPNGSNGAPKLLIFNVSNQRLMRIFRQDSAVSWTYGTSTWREANGSTTNGVQVMGGTPINPLTATVTVYVNNSGGAGVGVGRNTTTTNSSQVAMDAGVVSNSQITSAELSDPFPVGWNTYNWVEFGVSGATFYSNAGVRTSSGLFVSVWI